MNISTYHILNLEPDHYSPVASSILLSLGEVTNGPLTRAQFLQHIDEFDILIVRLGFQIDHEVLDRGSHLKVIVSATTGLDHIDITYAQTRAIAILSLQGEYEFLRSIPATAEHTWALLLALERHVPAAVLSVLEGKWDRDLFRGHDLAGKTLGILGMGRIGEKVAHYGMSFGMRVIAYDPLCVSWPKYVERTTNQKDLLQQSQVFSIHVPLNDETRGMIKTEELHFLPEDALLINTARGEILDERALLVALEQGRIAGAALDVIWNERIETPQRSALLRYAREHDNLLITPHIGGATFESMAATEIFMARKLVMLLNSLAVNN